MIASFVVSVVFFALGKTGKTIDPDVVLLWTVGLTTATWLVVTFLTKPVDLPTLVAFYDRVRPAGPGWARVRAHATAGGSPDSLPLALAGWVLGLLAIYSALFGTGAYLYGNTVAGILCTVIFVVSTTLLITVISRIWTHEARASELESIAKPA